MKKSTKYQLIILCALLFVAITSGLILSQTNTAAITQTTKFSTIQTPTSAPQTVIPEPAKTTPTTKIRQIIPAPEISDANTSTYKQPAASTNSEEKISATLFINDKKYEAAISPNSNVYELMSSLANQPDFRFKAKNYPNIGYFIEEINGIKNNQLPGYNWIYYINNGKATVGVSNYLIKSNDIITWKYETTNF